MKSDSPVWPSAKSIADAAEDDILLASHINLRPCQCLGNHTCQFLFFSSLLFAPRPGAKNEQKKKAFIAPK